MRANKLSVTTKMISILLENPAITGMIEDKIFPLMAPKGVTGDFILYKRESYEAEWNKMGKTRDSCKVYFNVISDSYQRSQAVSAAIHETLEGEFSQPEMTIRLLDSTEDYTDGKYIQVLLFSIE